MLGSFVDVAIIVSLVATIIDVFANLQNTLIVRAALPPGAEDEIVLIEHLPGRRVHLEDFFWTGAEDAPPWLDPDQVLSLHEGRTVHHTSTIYVPVVDGTISASRDPGPGSGQYQPSDPGCVSCIDPTPTLVEVDQDIGILVGEDPGPRYWLLTVLRSGESVPPKVELRLARLYRAAFSRQQQRHLGLLAKDPRLRRATGKSRRAWTEPHESSLNETTNNPEANNNIKNNSLLKTSEKMIQGSSIDATSSGSEDRGEKPKKMREIQITKVFDENNNTKSLQKLDNTTREFLNDKNNNNSNNNLSSTNKNNNNTKINEKVLKTENASESDEKNDNWLEKVVKNENINNDTKNETTADGKMQIRIKTNSTGIRGGRLYEGAEKIAALEGSTRRNRSIQSESTNGTPSKLRSIEMGIVQIRMQNTSITETGSTKLIYSVHLGGKPVPAETAAKDMALLSPQEVALELGVPVIIQSEPYLKETRPLALSRKRDAWLLVGAAGAAMILLALVISILLIAAKRKRAHSAVSAPPVDSILKKDRRGYSGGQEAINGHDNTGYTTETEGRTQTDGTSQRQTPGSRSMVSPITPLSNAESLPNDIEELSSGQDEGDEDEGDEEVEVARARSSKRGSGLNRTWDIEEYPGAFKKYRKMGRKRITRSRAIEESPSLDGNSMETGSTGSEDIEELVGPVGRSRRRGENELETEIEEAEKNGTGSGPIFGDDLEGKFEETASPHSYLSMPPCKFFPNMRSVEPLSKILEPVVVRHLDIDCESPETESGRSGIGRTRSALRDPGVVGPIVWDLTRRRGTLPAESATSETDGPITEAGTMIAGPVGRARRRLYELLEDSFSLFGTRDGNGKSGRDQASFSSPDQPPHCEITFSGSRGKSAHVSPVATPITEGRTRPRTSVAARESPEVTGHHHPRSAWGSRPLSAGPFHRPNLPEVNANRVHADPQLSPEDPAVPLIAAIRKELDKFSPKSGR